VAIELSDEVRRGMVELADQFVLMESRLDPQAAH
jgi:hypothetical protein